MTIKTIIKGIKLVSKDVSKSAKRELDFLLVKPSAALLFLTYRCDSQCKTCTLWKRPQNEEKQKEIHFEKWKIIIDKLNDAGIDVVEIFGGNVLLRKDLLISLLKYLRQNNFKIHLPTNQIGLDTETLEVISDCVDALYISIDGVGEYQELIRGQKGAFVRADNTIKKLVSLRHENNKYIKRIICNTTVSKYNIHKLEEIIQYAIKSEFDEIHFELCGQMTQEDINNSKINYLKPAAYFIKQDDSILLNHNQATTLHKNLLALKDKYKNNGILIQTINIDALSVDNIVEGTIPHKKCYVERNEVTIDPSGNMVGCVFFNNYTFGNLVKESFSDIWNNDRHKTFRKFQNTKKIAMCRHCILGVQRNPSFFSSLQRIYLTRIKPRLRSI